MERTPRVPGVSVPGSDAHLNMIWYNKGGSLILTLSIKRECCEKRQRATVKYYKLGDSGILSTLQICKYANINGNGHPTSVIDYWGRKMLGEKVRWGWSNEFKPTRTHTVCVCAFVCEQGRACQPPLQWRAVAPVRVCVWGNPEPLWLGVFKLPLWIS